MSRPGQDKIGCRIMLGLGLERAHMPVMHAPLPCMPYGPSYPLMVILGLGLDLHFAVLIFSFMAYIDASSSSMWYRCVIIPIYGHMTMQCTHIWSYDHGYIDASSSSMWCVRELMRYLICIRRCDGACVAGLGLGLESVFRFGLVGDLFPHTHTCMQGRVVRHAVW